MLKENPSEFVGWILSKPLDEVVGLAVIAKECPFANFLNEVYPAGENKKWLIGAFVYGITNADSCKIDDAIDIPEWANRIKLTIDRYGGCGTPVNAGEIWTILNRLNYL